MGQKVNPIGFRTGVMVGWKSRWFASKQEFANLLVEDAKVRDFIKKHPKKTAISKTPASIESRSSELATKSRLCCMSRDLD